MSEAITGIPPFHGETQPILEINFRKGSIPTAVLSDEESLNETTESSIHGISRWTSRPTPSGFQYSWSLWQTSLNLAYRFEISPDGQRIDVIYQPPTTIQHSVPMLVHPLLPFVLRVYHQLLCLHAGVITLGDHTVAVIGAAGMGKSTLLLAAIQRGSTLLADDVAAIQIDPDTDTIRVCASVPAMKVDSQALATVFGDNQSALHITRSADPLEHKTILDVSGQAYWSNPQPRPLDAIFVLEPRNPALQAPLIEDMDFSAALITLMQNRYGSFEVAPYVSQREFRSISALVSNIPVYRVLRPDGLSHIPATLAGMHQQLQQHEHQ